MLLDEFNWKREVLESPEPVLVDFWASWCGPCRMMHPAIESLAHDYKVCKVNIDTNQQLAAHYGVSVVPTLLIFKEGRIAARHEGVTQESALRNELATLQHAI